MEKTQQKKKKNTGLYIVGSLALAAGAVIVMPKVIDYLTEKMYAPASSSTSDDDDDWGPEIVKKEKVTSDPDVENDEAEVTTDGEL